MISKDQIKKRLQVRSTQKDYSFGIIFLILSSFFIFFVIRPVLRIAFALQKEKTDLSKIEKALNDNFNTALKLRSELEDVRPELPLIETSIPSRAQIDKISQDFFLIASNNSIKISEIDFDGVKLLKNETSASNEAFLLKTKFSSTQANFLQFLQSIYKHPHIIALESLKILPQNKNKSEVMDVEMIMSISNWW